MARPVGARTKGCLVRWQDDSTNTQRLSEGLDGYPYGSDYYKEIDSQNGYNEFMDVKVPFGRNEIGEYNEHPTSNPSTMSEEKANELAMVPPSYSGEETEALAKAFKSLTGKQQEVWVLCMRDGRSENDVAEILGINRNAVFERLRGAKKKFQEVLRQAKEQSDVEA